MMNNTPQKEVAAFSIDREDTFTADDFAFLQKTLGTMVNPDAVRFVKEYVQTEIDNEVPIKLARKLAGSIPEEDVRKEQLAKIDARVAARVQEQVDKITADSRAAQRCLTKLNVLKVALNV